jgi:hypothetical protein
MKGGADLKKRILALTLCLALLLSLPLSPTAGAASDICFIALNDTLPDLGYLAYTQRSTVYVPYSVFETFRIYHSYYATGSIASLYTSTTQVYFDLASGNTYDGSGEYYSTSAIMRGGTVYVSVSFVCSKFGLTWSYINGTGSGDVCRIKDSSVVLSDGQFLSAASSLMTTRYNAYTGVTSPGGTSASPDASPTPGTSGCDLYLSFQGLPSDAMLDTLKAKSVTACFFLSAGDVRADPDTVRRIVGEGHRVGALCSYDPAAEYAEISALLFDAARVRTVLIAADSEESEELCRAAAEDERLVFWDYGVDGIQEGSGVAYSSLITVFLGFCRVRADVRILCCEASDRSLSGVLSFIDANNYNYRPVREVGAPD